MPESDQKPPLQILLVEDTLDQALLLRTLLERKLGAKVTLAQDGIRGCQLAENERWDVVITDLNLPGRDGMEVIEASKEVHPDVPVIATTAYTAPHYVDQAYRNGADAVLEKPLDDKDLLVSLERLVGPLGLEPEPEPELEPGAEPEPESPPEPAPGPEPPAETDTEVPPPEAPSADADTVLAIGALPGDVELGCGGVLLRHKERGHRVVILHITGGEEGTDSSRKTDAQEAAQLLGAHLVIGDSFGDAVPNAREMMTLVERTVEDFRPIVVYAPSANDVRESRQNTNRAANLAASEVSHFFCYQAPTSTMDFHPTLFVDIGEYMETKLSALASYAGQVESRPHLDPEFVTATARYWGRFLGYGLVEPLEVVRGEKR